MGWRWAFWRWVLYGVAAFCGWACAAAFAAGEPGATTVLAPSGWPDPGTFTGPGAVALMWLYLRDQLRDIRSLRDDMGILREDQRKNRDETTALRVAIESREARFAEVENDARMARERCEHCPLRQSHQ